MKLIVGLGNPGAQYDKTRHNVGFVVLDSIARRHAAGVVGRSKFHGVLLDTNIKGQRVLLLKPTTFMNCSGQAVAEALRFYRIDSATHLLVIVDDVALECGLLRLRESGGAGGHNGLTDIEEKLSTDQYPRLRIGIDSSDVIPQREYVLGKFRPDQQELINAAIDTAVDACVCWVLNGTTETMNRYNRKNIA